MPILAPQMPKKLAECAFMLFSEQGFKQVTLDNIAEKAGVTKGSLYHHYDSKKALILAACAHYYRSWQRQVHAEIAAISNPLERLERVVSISVRSCVIDQRNRVFTTEIFALSLFDADVRVSWAQFYDTAREIYIGLLEAARLANQVQIEDPRRAVDLMLTAMEGIKQQALFEPHICDAQAQQEIVDDLMCILGRPRPSTVSRSKHHKP